MSQEKFAKSIYDFSLEAIPDDIIHEAKRCLMTYIGSAICAHRENAVSVMYKMSQILGNAPQATVLGTELKADMTYAAWCNGISGTMYDFDDTMMDTILHPSCPIFPAVMAWGEVNNITGDQLLRSFVLGVEVEERIGCYLTKKGHFDYGWHMIGTAGMFGAAAAVGKLLGLTLEETINEVGMVCSQACGIRANFSTDTKAMHPGNAAAKGLLTALLVKEGMTASHTALDSEKGFGFLYSSSPDYEFLNQDWDSYQILKNTYKPYPCGVVNFPSIDAAVRIFKKGINHKDIDKVILEVNYLANDVSGHRQHPNNYIEAKASLHHGVAVGLVRGKAGLKEYTDEAVFNDDIVALRSKIEIINSPDVSIDESRVTVILSNGEKVVECTEQKSGTIGVVMPDEQMEEKFRDMVDGFISKEKQDELISVIWNMEKEPDIKNLIRLCVADV